MRGSLVAWFGDGGVCRQQLWTGAQASSLAFSLRGNRAGCAPSITNFQKQDTTRSSLADAVRELKPYVIDLSLVHPKRTLHHSFVLGTFDFLIWRYRK
jgi:hypothetical protein